MDIQKNYQRILEAISRSAREAGRRPEEIRLVVVTKSQPLEAILMVIEAGARYLGENYAEKALPKIDALGDVPGVEWHMIGHVQSRKAYMVCKFFSYVHSLDSLKLAERYNSYAEELVRTLPVLLEFNMSGEETKSGFQGVDEESWDKLLPEVEQIANLPNLEVLGLMTMAPFFADPEGARPYFKKLRRLQSFLEKKFPQANWGELSMGMSSDFEVAIQEGATWLRIGQAIMGPREG